MKRKAVIFGISGTKLTASEKLLFKRYKPWGLILFSRNIKNLFQLKSLTDEIKNILNDQNYPILIDEEGGKVSRISKIVNLSAFSQNYFGKLYERNRSSFMYQYKAYVYLICNTLKNVGININTVPVLDVKRKYTHKVIGNRSFSENPNIVSSIGKICINLYNEQKIGTVIKHIPGHGLSKIDTHFDLPIIKSKKSELINNDFVPFKKCKSQFAMTCHSIYEKYDPINTATHSKLIIGKVIRKHMNFKGILISDDISMKALKHGLEKNTIMALDAGCNLILHCNANIKEMAKLVNIVPTINNFIQKKTSDFYKFLR